MRAGVHFNFATPSGSLRACASRRRAPRTLPLVANAGLGMLMTNQKGWDAYRQDVADFNSVRAGHGWAPCQPTVVVTCACVDTEEETWEMMMRHRIEGVASSGHHCAFNDTERFRNTPGYDVYAEMSELAPNYQQTLMHALDAPLDPEMRGSAPVEGQELFTESTPIGQIGV